MRGLKDEMGKVSENIFSGENAIIPMAEVQYIERDKRDGFTDGIMVILSGTTWNAEIDHWNNSPYLSGKEAESFLSCWCFYRSELESETIMNTMAEEKAESLKSLRNKLRDITKNSPTNDPRTIWYAAVCRIINMEIKNIEYGQAKILPHGKGGWANKV